MACQVHHQNLTNLTRKCSIGKVQVRRTATALAGGRSGLPLPPKPSAPVSFFLSEARASDYAKLILRGRSQN